MYWFFISLFSVCCLIFLILTIRRFIENDSEFGFGNLLLFIISSAIVTSILLNADYSQILYEKICPDRVSIMHDNEECIIKYGDNRWETTQHSEYLNILNNNFYIQKYKTFNIFNQDNGDIYKLIFSNEECFEPIKI